MVLNESRVIAARVHMRKRRGEGGAVEVMCLSPVLPSTDPAAALQAGSGAAVWKCMLRGKRIRPGEVLGATIAVPHSDSNGMQLSVWGEVEERDGKEATVKFGWEWVEGSDTHADDDRPASGMPVLTLGQVLELVGQVPLPPYMQRAPVAEDLSSYQTV